jgi:transposase-like protein
MEQPKTLQKAIRHFSNERVCIDTIAALRWPEGKPVCPACEKTEHYYLATQKRWKCKECHKQFSVKLGTIFEDSPITLDKWLTALWMIVNCRNGVSSYEVGRAIGITQKSAWFVLHRLRFALQTGSITKLGGNGAPVQVDETFIGGKARFMHRVKRERLSRNGGMQGGSGKAVVVGLLERGGKVKTAVLAHRRENGPEKIVREMVEPGTEIHTDEFPGYYNLKDGYMHKVVNHLEGYVKENIHTNGIENFWSCLKRGLAGTYIAVEPFHLFRYVDEQAFRFNNRKDADNKPLKDWQRFELALSQIAGKRLTFAEVTGKVGETAF